MTYDFLIDTYESECIKVVSVWSEFRDGDLPVRPRQSDPRGRSVHEQMVHQCMSENIWFRDMLGIDVGAPPLPPQETRMGFIRRYVEDSGKRLAALRETRESWWQDDTQFFDVRRSRAWVMTRRMTHTSHHRGQLMAMLRMLGRDRAQQLRADRRHGRPDAEPRADHLCLRERGGPAQGEAGRWCESRAPGSAGRPRDRASIAVTGQAAAVGAGLQARPGGV